MNVKFLTTERKQFETIQQNELVSTSVFISTISTLCLLRSSCNYTDVSLAPNNLSRLTFYHNFYFLTLTAFALQSNFTATSSLYPCLMSLVVSPHCSDQMSQKSQVSRITLSRCSLNVFVFGIFLVFVFVFIWSGHVSSSLCLKSHTSLGSLFDGVL